jgi:hypothetical protein
MGERLQRPLEFLPARPARPHAVHLHSTSAVVVV